MPMITPDRLASDVKDSTPLPELVETDAPADPLLLFRAWLDQAVASQPKEPYAMTLATATSDGRPSARMVLLRGFDERGFVFFTNFQSRKGVELRANPHAALVLYWADLDKQVRIEGRVETVSAEESDAYFDTRPRGSRIGAWASPQSAIVPDRATLERREADYTKQFADGPVPRPPHWGGFRVIPEAIEFWHGRPNRLHDRLRYLRSTDGAWMIERLAP